MPLDPKRTISELKELRGLTGDANGAQRVAWTQTLAESARVVCGQGCAIADRASLRRSGE